MIPVRVHRPDQSRITFALTLNRSHELIFAPELAQFQKSKATHRTDQAATDGNGVSDGGLRAPTLSRTTGTTREDKEAELNIGLT